MLGIDSKREAIKGHFAVRIWSEILAMWQKGKAVHKEESENKYTVEWLETV